MHKSKRPQISPFTITWHRTFYVQYPNRVPSILTQYNKYIEWHAQSQESSVHEKEQKRAREREGERSRAINGAQPHFI